MAKSLHLIDATRIIEERSVPVPEAGCWIWIGPVGRCGYGIVALGERGKKEGAHRVSWAAANGPIKDGLCVCHKCDTPSCVNPAHLFLGTNGDNMRDRKAKGRYLGDWNGRAKLSKSDVREIRDLNPAMSRSRIARAYGVGKSMINDICRGKTWTHM